jgi:Raf kinase inhibitor-like YbhB/YbcL family protein
VPAVVSALGADGVLTITGDATENKVTVRQEMGTRSTGEQGLVVKVDGTYVQGGVPNYQRAAFFDADKVQQIEFSGNGTTESPYGGPDTFTNKTAIDYYVSTDVVDKTFAGLSHDSSNGTFTLTSTDITDGRLPPSSASSGDNKPPKLTLTAPPPGTKSYALIMEDRSAAKEGFKGKFTHWVLYNIPADTQEISMAQPEGTRQGADAWQGPNPRDGKPHTYVFTLYALGENFTAPDAGATQQQLMDAMKDHIVGQTSLRGTFGGPSV